jgi:hypothetical protein
MDWVIDKPVFKFKTKKGSQYRISKDGESQRNKSYHPEHGVEDQGVKRLYKYAYYLDTNDATDIAVATKTVSPFWIVVNQNVNQIGVITVNDGKAKFVTGPFDFEREPHIGISPIELEDLVYHEQIQAYYCRGYSHVGNSIVEVEVLK